MSTISGANDALARAIADVEAARDDLSRISARLEEARTGFAEAENSRRALAVSAALGTAAGLRKCTQRRDDARQLVEDLELAADEAKTRLASCEETLDAEMDRANRADMDRLLDRQNQVTARWAAATKALEALVAEFDEIDKELLAAMRAQRHFRARDIEGRDGHAPLVSATPATVASVFC